ncbi:MAG: LPS assembly lipoprotein LptE [Bacteroidia bacterium]|jgi:hypothetical protein|nr:LPS assembly lipoprotein LptE [Bacteroidia bacterium]|tara:strand:+ start:207 stop:707 length:501 start_codon:yes stop_codon:yes gene_type:complete
MIWNKLTPLCFLLASCCGKFYNFKGANIPPDIKNFSVEIFKNEAEIVNPELANAMTEKLKTKFQQQTSLGLVQDKGDYSFASIINEYRVEPASLSPGQGTAQNKFSISVLVDFKCAKYPEKDFSKSYANFRNFDASEQFSAVEKNFAEEIADNIIQQIFADVALDW